MTFIQQFNEKKIFAALQEIEFGKTQNGTEQTGTSLAQIGRQALCSKNTVKKYIGVLKKTGHIQESKIPWAHDYGFALRYRSSMTWKVISPQNRTVAQTSSRTVADHIKEKIVSEDEKTCRGLFISYGPASPSKIYNTVEEWEKDEDEN
jgi:hypothetical protein